MRSAQGRVIFGHSGLGREARSQEDWGMWKDRDERAALGGFCFSNVCGSCG